MDIHGTHDNTIPARLAAARMRTRMRTRMRMRTQKEEYPNIWLTGRDLYRTGMVLDGVTARIRTQ